MLKMERLKARAREIFQRLEINLCFLDDELLKEFMTQADQLDEIIKQSRNYVSKTDKVIKRLNQDNETLKEQDEYNQNELTGYIEELDEIEKVQKKKFKEYQSKIDLLEKNMKLITFGSLIVFIYAFLIGAIGLCHVIYYHYLAIVYYPIMFIMGIVTILWDAIVIHTIFS